MHALSVIQPAASWTWLSTPSWQHPERVPGCDFYNCRIAECLHRALHWHLIYRSKYVRTHYKFFLHCLRYVKKGRNPSGIPSAPRRENFLAYIFEIPPAKNAQRNAFPLKTKSLYWAG